ncbi:MAG: L,D-transpeptidase family protein [Clostridia bacterium]|nr:L,D-transpeptidase family protein [Clostridia bacterium]
MKKRYILLSFGLVVAISVLFVVKKEIVDANTIPSVIRPSAVFAAVPQGAVLYDNVDGNAVNLILSGEKVEILKDRNEKWYYVRYKNRLGWVKNTALSIPPDMSTNTSKLSDKVILDYANSSLESKTSHFVWVDIDRQRVYILKGENGKRSIEKRIVCATGHNTSPTVRGLFEISDRGKWFYSERLGSGAMYWVRFNGSYLFHSVAMDKDKKITDDVLGRKRSSGCVRMSVEDAEWFFNNIETGTGVWIY